MKRRFPPTIRTAAVPSLSMTVGTNRPGGNPWGSHHGWGSRPLRRPYDVYHRGESAAAMGVGHTVAAADDAEDEDPQQRRMRCEAVLLLAKSPLSTRKLAQLAQLADGTEARTRIRELNEIYSTHHRAMRIEKLAGGYRMVTRAALAPWLRRLSHVPGPIRLSSPMMETLAVVAYRQPVSRADAEAVRGVACGEILRQLMERDLIRIAGRSEQLGRPYLYGTTKRFLQLFGLTGADDLPKIQWQAVRDDPPSDPNDPTPNESPSRESNFDESSTSTKESVVSTAMASPIEFTTSQPDQAAADSDSFAQDQAADVTASPVAVIEDEEDELYEGGFDDDDDEEIDDDEFSDDWADEEDDDDDEDSSDDDDEEDDLDDDWEEVGDDDDEDWDEEDESDDWDDDDESADDDEDWSE